MILFNKSIQHINIISDQIQNFAAVISDTTYLLYNLQFFSKTVRLAAKLLSQTKQ